MTFHHHEGGAEVVRLDHSRRVRWDSACEEFHALMCQRDQIDARLNVLIGIIDPKRAIREEAATLPQSGLTQAAPGVLLFKGGRLDR